MDEKLPNPSKLILEPSKLLLEDGTEENPTLAYISHQDSGLYLSSGALSTTIEGNTISQTSGDSFLCNVPVELSGANTPVTDNPNIGALYKGKTNNNLYWKTTSGTYNITDGGSGPLSYPLFAPSDNYPVYSFSDNNDAGMGYVDGKGVFLQSTENKKSILVTILEGIKINDSLDAGTNSFTCGSMTCGNITSGSINADNNSFTCGTITCGNMTSGSINAGTNSFTCGSITCSSINSGSLNIDGDIDMKTHNITNVGYLSTSNLTMGSNYINSSSNIDLKYNTGSRLVVNDTNITLYKDLYINKADASSYLQDTGGSGGVLRYLSSSGNNYIQSGTTLSADSSAPLIFNTIYGPREWFRCNADLSMTFTSVPTFNNGILLPTTGGIATNLSYYEEYSNTITWTGPLTATANIKIVRVGKMVTVSLIGVSGIATATAPFHSTGAIPSRFLNDSIVTNFFILTMVKDINYTGHLLLDNSTGNMTIYHNTNNGSFNQNQFAQFQNSSYSYNI